MIRIVDSNGNECIVMVSKIIMVSGETNSMTKLWLEDECWIYVTESVDDIYKKIADRPDFARIGG